jgi:putative NAD(P)H nitroreductase
LQRDEAIRSASLASMTLMLVAQSLGLATCPIIGFDPDRVAQIVGLDQAHVPVMLITIGKSKGTPLRSATRHPVERVVRLEHVDGRGLRVRSRRTNRTARLAQECLHSEPA